MKSSIFNLRVPLEGDEVFVMNTLSDAQAVISSDAAALLDADIDPNILDVEARAAFDELVENGFITPGRDYDRDALTHYLDQVTSDTSELNIPPPRRPRRRKSPTAESTRVHRARAHRHDSSLGRLRVTRAPPHPAGGVGERRALPHARIAPIAHRERAKRRRRGVERSAHCTPAPIQDSGGRASGFSPALDPAYWQSIRLYAVMWQPAFLQSRAWTNLPPWHESSAFVSDEQTTMPGTPHGSFRSAIDSSQL